MTAWKRPDLGPSGAALCAAPRAVVRSCFPALTPRRRRAGVRRLSRRLVEAWGGRVTLGRGRSAVRTTAKKYAVVQFPFAAEDLMAEPQNESNGKPTTDPKPPTGPRDKCAICGSTDHATGYHEGGLVGETMVMDSAGRSHFDEFGMYSDPTRGEQTSPEDAEPRAEEPIASILLWPTSAINARHFVGAPMSIRTTLPIAIYVSDEGSYDAVEESLFEFLDAIGIGVVAKGEPKRGSKSRWFEARRERQGVDSLDLARRAIEMQALDKEQARIDNQQADAVAKLVTSLCDTETALIQIGSVLLLKVDGRLVVRNLTQQEMILIRRKSSDLASPNLILEALEEFACGEGRLNSQERVRISEGPDRQGGSAAK